MNSTRLCRAGGIALSLALSLVACDKHSEPAKDSASPAPKRIDGTPQIANSTDGVHIQYRVYGEGEPALILIHCWACDSNYWSAQIAPLKAKYTVVTVDLTGHGGSGRNRTEWTMERYGDDVAAVAREIENPRIILVGHSMGGPVALEAARRIGARVIGIVAVDTLKTVGQPPVSEREIAMRVKPFRENFIGHTRDFVSNSFFTKDADPQFVRKVVDDMALEPEDIAVPSMEALMRMDYSKIVPEIRVPVVAINADRTGPTDEARIKKSLPAFTSVTIPNTGHFLMMETPERFNPVLLREVAALAKRGRN